MSHHTSRARWLVVAAAVTPIAGTVIAGQDWGQTPWHVECLDPVPCDPANEVYQKLLEVASQWLGGPSFAFPAPALAPDADHPGAFYAAVSDAETLETESATVPGQPYYGVYHRESRRLFLSSEHFFTLGQPGQLPEDGAFMVEALYEVIPVHELFHAVQAGYERPVSTELRWIMEGTADAVMRAFADTHRPNEPVRRPTRRFDVPLHKPASARDAYSTAEFWLRLGEAMGSTGRIAYIHDVLRADLEPNDGISGVDRALPRGLIAWMPKVFAGFPIARFQPQTDQAVYSGSSGIREHTIPLKVPELAGWATRLTLRSKDTRAVPLDIVLEPDLPSLHLIVDGLVADGSIGQPRNRAPDRLPAGASKTFEIVVANVGAPADRTAPTDAVVKVQFHPCEVPSQGDFEGHLGGDRARVISAGSRGAFAKILRSPLGGWALQLESRERENRDLSLTLMFDHAPTEGGTISITDPDLMAPGVAGMVDRFDVGGQAQWVAGQVTLDIDAVVEQPGRAFDWVCGSIRARVSGIAQPAPGSMQPQPISGDFAGRFLAEWHRR